MSDAASCPVCGAPVTATWRIEAGKRPDGTPFPAGTGYVHEPATFGTSTEYDKLGADAYDGAACYAFDDGSTDADGYPPQPVVP
jgi:hypothetical protein